MYLKENRNHDEYAELMEQIKHLNADWLTLRNSRQYRIGLVFCELSDEIKKLKFGEAIHSVKGWIKGKRVRQTGNKQEMRQEELSQRVPYYFSSERIVVYTAVFGNYDSVPEPVVTPDNVDYVLFTDAEITGKDRKSAWKRAELPEALKGLSNAQKNRYLKMNPHELFGEYKYSIYVDGNVQVISDLTEYIQELPSCGFAAHLHRDRNCIYDEIEAIRVAKRESEQVLDRHKQYLEQSGMPRGYGLLQCNVLVREHNNPVCISLMKQWWDMYQQYTKRDQISLPHVLYLHQIPVSEVAILGKDFYSNPAFRICHHKK